MKKKNTFKRLRNEAESLFSVKGLNLEATPDMDVRALVYELQIHQTELEMQNDELQRANAELEELKEKYENLYEFAPVGYLILDSRRVIREANRLAAKLLGTPKNKLIGLHITTVIAPEDQAAAQKHYQDALDTKTKQTCELRVYKCPDDLIVELETVLESTGLESFDQFKTVLKDITQTKLDQTSLAQAQTLLRATHENQVLQNKQNAREFERTEAELRKLFQVVECSLSPLMITDKYGVIEYVNPCFTKITGYSLNEIIGDTPRILKSGKHDDMFYKTLWDTIISGKQWWGKTCNKKKTGELYWESQCITPLKDDTGSITGFISARLDNTEQKRIEHELKEHMERSAYSEKIHTPDGLDQSIAHEFYHPLSGILNTLAQLEARERLSGEGKKLLNLGIKECGRMIHVMGKLQGFCKPAVEAVSPIELEESASATILIADSPSSHVEIYKKFLTKEGYEVFTVSTLESAALLLKYKPCAAALIGSALLENKYLSILQFIKQNCADCKLVLMTSLFDADTFMETLIGNIFHECLLATSEPSYLSAMIRQLIRPDGKKK